MQTNKKTNKQKEMNHQATKIYEGTLDVYC